jgi:hypothetical protein
MRVNPALHAPAARATYLCPNCEQTCTFRQLRCLHHSTGACKPPVDAHSAKRRRGERDAHYAGGAQAEGRGAGAAAAASAAADGSNGDVEREEDAYAYWHRDANARGLLPAGVGDEGEFRAAADPPADIRQMLLALQKAHGQIAFECNIPRVIMNRLKRPLKLFIDAVGLQGRAGAPEVTWKRAPEGTFTTTFRTGITSKLHPSTLINYAMCPDPLCGALMRLADGCNRFAPEDRKQVLSDQGPSSLQIRCPRLVLTEMTEWPADADLLGCPRPHWPGSEGTEPRCNAEMTERGSLEPKLLYCTRSLKAGLEAVLERPGNQDKCEWWRKRVPPAPAIRRRGVPAPAAAGDRTQGAAAAAAHVGASALPAAAAQDPTLLTDVCDGKMWQELQHWPPRNIDGSQPAVPGWFDGNNRHTDLPALQRASVQAGQAATVQASIAATSAELRALRANFLPPLRDAHAAAHAAVAAAAEQVSSARDALRACMDDDVDAEDVLQAYRDRVRMHMEVDGEEERRAHGAASALRLQRAQSDHEQAVSNEQDARAALELADQAHNQARLNAEATTVTAAAAVDAAAAAAESVAAAGPAFSYRGALLAAPHTIALQVFVDWYQTSKQGGHSQGIIWACVLNLPRAERYLLSNMVLVGVLPGPQQSSRQQLQSALQLLTKELRMLFTGKGAHGEAAALVVNDIFHRVFLFSLVGDTPAVRSCCGFGEVNAKQGACPYCDGDHMWRGRSKSNANMNKKDNHRDWRPSVTKGVRPNTHAAHVARAKEWVNSIVAKHPKFCPVAAADRIRKAAEAAEAAEEEKQNAVADRQGLRSSPRVPVIVAALAAAQAEPVAVVAPKLLSIVTHTKLENVRKAAWKGVRWSAVLDLPYYDAIRCTPIDAMHNLLLGLVKHMYQVFKGNRGARPGEAEPPEAPSEEEGQTEEEEEEDEEQEEEEEEDEDEEVEAQEEQEAQDEEKEAADDAEKPDASPPESGDESGGYDSDVPLVSAGTSAGAAAARGDSAAAYSPAVGAVPRKPASKSKARAKSQAKRAPPGVRSSLKGVRKSLFDDKDRVFLQSFVDGARLPRSIGRVTKRFVTGSTIKAVEWLNWATLFAVPTVRQMLQMRARETPKETKKKKAAADAQAKAEAAKAAAETASRAVAAAAEAEAEAATAAAAAATAAAEAEAAAAPHVPVLDHRHLEVFVLVHQIVSVGTGYVCDMSAVDRLATSVHALLRLLAELFPPGQPVNAFTPNLHLMQHLPEQIRNLGPLTASWCMPYERMMGLFTRMPYKTGSVTLSKAMRAATMLQDAVTAQAQPHAQSSENAAVAAPSAALAVFGPGGIPLPAGPGFSHGIRCVNNHAYTHVYAFTHDADGVAAAALLHQWRNDAWSPDAVRGCEPFPGALFTGGQPNSVTAQRKKYHATVPAALLGTGALKPKVGAIKQWLDVELNDLSQVAECLHVHYTSVHAWQGELRSFVDARLELLRQKAVEASDNSWRAALADLQARIAPNPTSGQRGAQTRRINADKAEHQQKLALALEGLKLKEEDLAVGSPHTRAWYRLHCGAGRLHAPAPLDPAQPQVDEYEDKIELFNKLYLAGEEYGSLAWARNNSYIAADYWAKEEQPRSRCTSRSGHAAAAAALQLPVTWYGQVSFYFKHTFKGHEHSFAMARWYNWVGEGHTAQGDARDCEEAMAHYHQPAFGAQALPASVTNTFRSFPIVSQTFHPMHALDMIPVHRIKCRWVPVQHHDKQNQFVCPITTKVHC